MQLETRSTLAASSSGVRSSWLNPKANNIYSGYSPEEGDRQVQEEIEDIFSICRKTIIKRLWQNTIPNRL